MARIRTLDFLPNIFQTPTNAEFLAATLDQVVNPPNTTKIQGYIGSKLGYGINAKDYYVTEPTKTRVDYQLEPGVVFTKPNESIAQDFISYPGLIDSLKLQGSITENNSELFQSQFYSWDSFTNLDKLVNFHQYYWLPSGPPSVTVANAAVYSKEEFDVIDQANGYLITPQGTVGGTVNPTLTLMRGGTYVFAIDQDSDFWIQTLPGVSGVDPNRPNVSTREVYGVNNNGTNAGFVTFTVPQKTSQDQYLFPGNNAVDVVSNKLYSEINNKPLRSYIDPVTNQFVQGVDNIDGVTELEGLTLMFYVAGEPRTTNYYTIQYVGNPANPTVMLATGNTIPNQQKITPKFGTEYIGRPFYRTTEGAIALIPEITSVLDTLYYQDGTSANKVGMIKLIDSNLTNTLNIETDILGKKNYTSTNGVVFTNGLKVIFEGDVFPLSYRLGEYYVEGVGTAIELIPASALLSPEDFTIGEFIEYDSLGYDIGNYDIDLYLPVEQDYITIARNSLGLNPWSRSNRWFHSDVIAASAQYNNNPNILTEFANGKNKAKRPIIEFYPNLKLFDTGVVGKEAIDFIDNRATDALSDVAGLFNYFPDVEVYTKPNAVIDSTLIPWDSATDTGTVNVPSSNFIPGQTYQITKLGITDWNKVCGTFAQRFVLGQKIVCVDTDDKGDGNATGRATLLATETKVTVPTVDIVGKFQLGMYAGDSLNSIPPNTSIVGIENVGLNTVLTLSWNTPANIPGGTTSIVGTDTPVGNYNVFPGARIVFAADLDKNVRSNIYVVDFAEITPGSTPVIVLTLAEDGESQQYEQLAVKRGYKNQGKSFYFDAINWLEAQQKNTVNQPPLFDVFDKNGISFGDNEVYRSTNFKGNKLFAYGIGTGSDDPVLGFPVRYSSVNNTGDLSFDVSLNIDSFDYITGLSPVTQKVNTGYVHNYVDGFNYTRLLGWETAIAPSAQYQVFSFDYDPVTPVDSFECDISVGDINTNEWPRVKVFINNVFQEPSQYQVSVTDTTTTITLNSVPFVETVIQILLLSDQVSQTAYYDIPVNLNNNPLNADLTTANIGDINAHYQDIFINAPNTTGTVFGSNNYRDLGNLNPYGTKIIQNSASLVLPGTFLRKQNHNLFDALLFNSREYIKFKQLLVDTVQNTDYNQRFTPSEILNIAIDQITAAKSQINAFFWSDMLPIKAPYRSNTYTFKNNLDNTVYPLSQTYDFTSANYKGILVYLLRTIDGVRIERQLTRGVDYTIDSDTNYLTITTDLLAGDQVIINEFNQTYGSYVPNTPTKLGIYPSFQPQVVLDSNYTIPTYFIRGHDGSFTKLYGEYIPETNTLVDFRDQALLEFELRVYNNLKLSTIVPISDYEVLPGFFRDSSYTWDQFIQMYSPAFLNWVGQNRLDYKTQFYNRNNEYTYNYTNSANKLDNSPIQQGYWRGVYEYLYDTTTPDSTPWEMLGFTDMPTWWTDRYGPVPYTSDNKILWEDLESGYVWNDGDPYIVPELARPGLSNILPVNSNGDLLTPLYSVVGNYNPSTFQKDWKVGDMGPVELSYRRSSTWPFDLVRLFALTRPAEFFNLAVDLDNYKYSEEFNQYLVNDRSHLIINDIEIYGNGTPKTSYINWIVDYEKQLGVDATNNITTLLDNLDVRLVYRLAGYSDKSLLNFYVEKGSPNSRNASLLIPDESYSLLLYDNQPFDRIMYSGVVIQKEKGYYAVYGNSQNFAYFPVQEPLNNGDYYNISVGNVNVKLTNNYTDKEILVPYGSKFYSLQELSQFLMSYAKLLENKGMIFDTIINGIEVNWRQMVAELLYWAQTGWDDGSIIMLNPAATDLKISKDSHIVQPLTIQQQNFILNQNLYPIQLNDLCVQREDTLFKVHTLNEGDAMSYGQFNISNFEYGIVFDNQTLFNDVIYDLTTGLRQNRIYVRGTKTAEWNGTINAWGFILNQDNVQEWSRDLKYTKGAIVKYKNKYWTSLNIIEPSNVFNEQDWKEINYENVQKGMLPNPSTRAYESTLFYNVNKANLEQDTDLLSFSLIGYRPRDFLSVADLTDITQVNVYQNMIKNKGTRNAVEAFKGANLPQGEIKYDVYENWAIKTGEFGGVLNDNFVEFRLSQTNLTGNPSIVSLTEGLPTIGSMQEVPLYRLFNYGRPVDDPNILNTLPKGTLDNPLYPNAGYVNFDDVRMSAYYYANLPNAVDSVGDIVPIQNFYVGQYAWMANFKAKWDVFKWKPIGEVVQVRNNLNNTATLTFNVPHQLKKLDPVSVVNFSNDVDGYYLVVDVVSLNEVIVNLQLINSNQNTVQGRGLGLTFESQRVAKPSDIKNLSLLSTEFTKNTVWVDENTDGGWAVYRKNLNFEYKEQLSVDNGINYGSAVAYSSDVGYLVSDPKNGVVYRYTYNPILEKFIQVQQLTNIPYRSGETPVTGVGSVIAHASNMFVIPVTREGPDGSVQVYTINDSVLSDDLIHIDTMSPGVAPGYGRAVAISGDANWIYVSDSDGKIYIYNREFTPYNAAYLSTGTAYQITSLYETVNAGSFVVGETYTILELGNTDFTLVGASSNEIGVTFNATGKGSGTGTAHLPATDFTPLGAIENKVGIIFQYQAQDANVLVIGAKYEITELGDTDWNVVAGTTGVNYQVGDMITVVAHYSHINDEVPGKALGIGSGTGTVNKIDYDYQSYNNTIICDDYGYAIADDFGASLSTNYDGSILVVGAPSTSSNKGAVAIFQRSVQNIEVQVPSKPDNYQTYPIAWTPKLIEVQGTGVLSGSKVVLSSTVGIAVDNPVVFDGVLGSANIASGISATQVYYVAEVNEDENWITLKTSRSTDEIVTLNAVSGLSFVASVQNNPMSVYKNGVLVGDNNYAYLGSNFAYYGSVKPGDILTVSDNIFTLAQELTPDYNDRTNIYFGKATDASDRSSLILVGAPNEIDDKNNEGAVYVYGDGGLRYGVIIGTDICEITSTRKVLINGYLVDLPAGDARVVSNSINASGVTNVQASYTSDNRLIIQLINQSLAQENAKLSVVSFDPDAIDEMGITTYSRMQKIKCPHEENQTRFGAAIKINEFDSVVISATTGDRYEGTRFDFTDDENLLNDTVFDNNSTQFVESYDSAGAVYMFDYLAVNNESLVNPGAFVYAQSINSFDTEYGSLPLYGSAVDFNDNVVIVGAPDFLPITVGGQVTIYENTVGIRDWNEYRTSAPIVDIDKIQNSQLFSATDNNTLTNLDYIDPLQGKILGAARENIDYVSAVDPANYNSQTDAISGFVWGESQVGQIWFDTTNVRFINYHQNDPIYNSRYWGTLFPGSDVAVYTWIASFIQPSEYQGPGIVYDPTKYAISSTLNSSGVVVPVYYFWVRNTNIISENRDKTLSDATIASYIENPMASGVSYMAPLLPNTFALYNSLEYFNANDTVFHIGYANGLSDDVSHSEFALIREDYEDDFLPGLPVITNVSGAPAQGIYANAANEIPFSLYARMLDSLAGCDNAGAVVPNPFLPKAVQSGVLARPRQSFFYNRYLAVKNFLTYANTVLAQYPITELKPDISFLYAAGEVNPSTVNNEEWKDAPELFYDTANYWEFVDWWAPGYDTDTKPDIQVPIYADLYELVNSPVGTIVRVEQNGAGKAEVYRYDGNGVWSRVGLENGTISFKLSLWDYGSAKIGFGDNFYDTVPYDQYPSEETRYIIRALCEQIYTEDLLIYRNKSLITLFNYIQSESIESQNFLPWLNKTSLVDVSHTIRELKPYEVFVSDNQEFLSGYVNEVKPYHVVIKDFLFDYKGSDVFIGDITDFDVPATYNTTYQKFISPQLVYDDSDNEYQYTTDDLIWQTAPYSQWFNNRGLTLEGQPDYQMTALASYMDLKTDKIFVDNVSGFPVNGVFKIDDEEIGYAYVDRALNVVGGLVRGINGTLVTEHIPGANITMNLPAVILLDAGRGYSNPPKVTAYVDTTKYPAPLVPAQLEAVMNLDSVLSINVVNPGAGYVVQPEIIIEPSAQYYFADSNINARLKTLTLTYATTLVTGSIVKFMAGSNGVTVGKLVSNQWYYVGVLATSPATIIAFYETYQDAIKDHNRIAISPNGTSTDMYIAPGAKATAIPSSNLVRDNAINMRYDRTSYRSQVKDWKAESFYGSFFAGTYYNSDKISSSAIQLQSSLPDINDILASAQGVALQISKVDNDRKLEWSSFIRTVKSTSSVDNSIRLAPLDKNNPDLSELEPYNSGTTIGFYEGMPIMLTAPIANLLADKIYYVNKVLNTVDFTVSLTPGGEELVLLSDTRTGVELMTGEVIDTAILTVEYPGILQVTATQSNTNVLTVPMTAIGTGGTTGLYRTQPLFFTGDVFGSIVENAGYYVTSVIDSEHFTMSENKNPLTAVVTETQANGNKVSLESTEGFSLRDPIIFEIDGADDFGNIKPGTFYYVLSIISGTDIVISEVVNGTPFVVTNELASETLSATAVNQKDTLALSTATGSMTMNVSLPVSPGQVDGQLFTLYKTSTQYPNISTDQISGIIERTITATIHGTIGDEAINRVAFSEVEGDTTFFYVNMPVKVTAPGIGGLTDSAVYYVAEYSGEKIPDPINPGKFLTRPNIEVDVTNTVGGELVCETTASLYVGMPLVFSGQSIGGIVITQQYFVKAIIDETHFTISETKDGTQFMPFDSSGVMTGEGDAYIVLKDALGDVVPVTSELANGVSFYQDAEPELDRPVFSVSYVLGGYRVVIENPSSGFAINNVLVIPGTEVGGSTPANDITLIVNRIGPEGQIEDVICRGVVPTTSNNYYLDVRGANTLAVYSDPMMQLPVSGVDFPYTGFTEVEVYTAGNSENIECINLSAGIAVNDAVVFTGNVPEGLIVGQTYYVLSINDSTVRVCEVPGDDTPVLVTGASANFLMTKPGSIALLPEPFIFNQSIVRFNNRIYRCVISNNDSEFIFGKWELLDPADRILNAMDRTIGYYQPTIDMPGVDLSQLFDGVTYPYPIYKGNAFEPNQQFVIDTRLKDQPFYPTDITSTAVMWDGKNYYTAANLPGYSTVLGSVLGDAWTFNRIANSNVGLTDIKYADGIYVMTSTNRTTPIYRSNDGITWTTNGYFTPYGYLPYDTIPYDMTSISVAALALSSVTYANGMWIAVGENIVVSDDTYVWREVTNFAPSEKVQLNGVSNVTTGPDAFNGAVAVGKNATGGIVYYSENGLVWNNVSQFTTKTLNAVASDGTTAIIVGDNGVIFYSNDGDDWFGLNEINCISVNPVTNQLNLVSTLGLAVDTKVVFNNSFSAVIAGVEYYVNSIDSPTQITLTTGIGNPPLTLPVGVIPAGTFMSVINDPITDSINLNDLIHTSTGIWMAVGDSGIVKTSTEGVVWTSHYTGTTENLNGVTFNDDNTFVVVGDNDTILTSTDNGVTWSNASVVVQDETIYDVKGSDFPYGYGPEELVPGNVTDSLALKVTTRPGTNWPVVEYGHTGFGVDSIEYLPVSDLHLEYSFANLVAVPAQVSVQKIDSLTGLGRTLNPSEYTVDWVNKVVILDTPLSVFPGFEKLRIDVYSVGNGDQLVKSSTDNQPIRNNVTTGFDEIYVNCGYSREIFQGNGIVRLGTSQLVVTVDATESVTNRIVCAESVARLTLNYPITFTTSFSVIEEGKVYYVKSIDPVTSTFTISETLTSAGLAGPTLELTDTQEVSEVIIQNGPGYTWTPPVMYHNGNKLVFGTTSTVIRSSANNNALTTYTTAGLAPGNQIRFDQNIFGDVIEPFKVYYIKEIIDDNEFTISETVDGEALVLETITGRSVFFTNDYAFGIQPDGVSAKIILPSDTYTTTEDYLVYSLFGESDLVEYGYSIPETQVFEADGSNSYPLINYVGYTNPTNAIVEVDGVRISNAGGDNFAISTITNTVDFADYVPAEGSSISVTTFNDTRRQYLTTQYGITGKVVSEIIAINNELTPPNETISPAISGGDVDVVSTQGMIKNQTVIFKPNSVKSENLVIGTEYEIIALGDTEWNIVAGTFGLTYNVGDTFVAVATAPGTGLAVRTTYGGVLVPGQVYYIAEVLASSITVSETVDGPALVLNDEAGPVTVEVGGVPTVRITTRLPNGFVDNDLVRIDATEGSYQLNNRVYYVKVITDTTFDIYTAPYLPVAGYVNAPVTGISGYLGGGYAWMTGTYFLTTAIATATVALDNRIAIDNPFDFVEGTPVYFSQTNKVNGDTIMGGLMQGERYYVKDIGYDPYFGNEGFISISETRYGDPVQLEANNEEGITMNVTQWSQLNVDRIWVYVNGYRVPSSSLRINAPNEISILTQINAEDEVIITNMIPTATPNEEVYMNFINKEGEASVYNFNAANATWLTESLYELDRSITVGNVRDIINVVVQQVSADTPTDGYYLYGLDADKREITSVTVFNASKNQSISQDKISVVLDNIAPAVKIKAGDWISEYDTLVITTCAGNVVYINGELMGFESVDLNTNRLIGLKRGINNSAVPLMIPQYTTVYGLLSKNRLYDEYYDRTWNSRVYNETDGDPLQISLTAPALFLETGGS